MYGGTLQIALGLTGYCDGLATLVENMSKRQFWGRPGDPPTVEHLGVIYAPADPEAAVSYTHLTLPTIA